MSFDFVENIRMPKENSTNLFNNNIVCSNPENDK